MKRRVLLWALGAVAAAASVASGQQADLRYKWVYSSHNLLVAANITTLGQIMQRAHDAGYNGVVLADYKLQILDQVPTQYAANVAQLKTRAQQLDMDLYPSVFPVGYANGILAHDPNLIEGQPVRDALFMAGASDATLAPDPAVQISNGGFETTNGNVFPGFFLQDSPGQSTFADTTTVHGGTRSLRMANIGVVNPQYGNCRVAQTVAVSPWRQYHVSGWIRTAGFDRPGNVRIQALAPSTGRALCSYELGVQPTQDWTQYHMVFNTQANASVNVYFGVWGGNLGTLWWDDCQMEEVGLLNVLRRPGTPLTVRAETGSAVYKEGEDFEPVADPRLGNVPYAGNYEIYHASPPIRLTPGSRITTGQRLRVSFYHAITTDQGKPALCLSEPAAEDLLAAEVRRVYALFQPKGLFLAHDEIRVMNWCQACQGHGLAPGEILAQHIGRCVTLCAASSGSVERGLPLFVWSDMFDPAHNAVPNYYLCNGSVANSAAGLDPSITIVNWNYGQRAQSLPFFAGRGHRQILAGYYDGPPGTIRTWINDAHALNAPIAGAMYTTWAGNYADLEAFAQAAWGP
jgi:hypothetical protein